MATTISDSPGENATKITLEKGTSNLQDTPTNQTVEVTVEGKEVATAANSAQNGRGDPQKIADRKARKEARKAQKRERRAQRQGLGDQDAGRKTCALCGSRVDLLIRCMYRRGQSDWSMVCGKCWHQVSGGVADGDANHPHYRYGGLWKNRRAQKA